MSTLKDFEKSIADITKLTAKSKAQTENTMRIIYKEEAEQLSEELTKVEQQTSDSTPRSSTQAKLIATAAIYVGLLTPRIERATVEAVQQVARQTAEAHVKAGQSLLKGAGAKPMPQAAMIAQNEINATTARVTQKIAQGTVYSDRSTLSRRIWGNNKAIHDDIQTIAMNGIKEGKSVADISDLITKYVDPSVRKDWNKVMEDGFTVHRRNVEYNSQRLVRTVSQHSYQEATEDRARSNPFIKGFIWNANGSRPCPICLARDGTFYAKGEAPLDHPNGMCVLEPVIEDDDARLAEWIKGAEDRELTAYATSLGYEV